MVHALREFTKDARGKRNSTSVCICLDNLEDVVGIWEECLAARNYWNPIFHHMMVHKLKNLNKRITNLTLKVKYIINFGNLVDLDIYICVFTDHMVI